MAVNAKYNLHECEEQLSQILFTGAVIILCTSELLVKSFWQFVLFCVC